MGHALGGSSVWTSCRIQPQGRCRHHHHAEPEQKKRPVLKSTPTTTTVAPEPATTVPPPKPIFTTAKPLTNAPPIPPAKGVLVKARACCGGQGELLANSVATKDVCAQRAEAKGFKVFSYATVGFFRGKCWADLQPVDDQLIGYWRDKKQKNPPCPWPGWQPDIQYGFYFVENFDPNRVKPQR